MLRLNPKRMNCFQYHWCAKNGYLDLVLDSDPSSFMAGVSCTRCTALIRPSSFLPGLLAKAENVV